MTPYASDKPFNLQSAFPHQLPKAIQWAEERSQEIQTGGVPLAGKGLEIARSVGVQRPEQIRMAFVESLPLPEDEMLRRAALETGLLGPGMVGLTLGYSVLICQGHDSLRLLSHEFRHVYQYEQAGSIAAFLPVYLQQIAMAGYPNAPFEIDEGAHEIVLCLKTNVAMKDGGFKENRKPKRQSRLE